MKWFIYIYEGCMQAIFIIDTIMDHIARELGKDPAAVRGLNLYQKGQVRSNMISCERVNPLPKVTYMRYDQP